MNRRGPVAQILAIILVVAVPLVFVPPTAGQEGATLAGTVYLQEGRQPVDGAVLHAGDLRTGEIYSSAATNDDGDFVLSGLPPAAYKLAESSKKGRVDSSSPRPRFGSTPRTKRGFSPSPWTIPALRRGV